MFLICSQSDRGCKYALFFLNDHIKEGLSLDIYVFFILLN